VIVAIIFILFPARLEIPVSSALHLIVELYWTKLLGILYVFADINGRRNLWRRNETERIVDPGRQ